ncbi:MAG TPA: SH3 domain-containing protein, partial [Candidatus Limnocylindrales bacterium]|nr:SH3 domain-containing protein [Candidatus Limnocylindrales bacterium]
MSLGRRLAVPIALAILLVSIVPIGAGIAAASTSPWAASCDMNLRARPTTGATIRARIPSGTIVTVGKTVAGGWYATRCGTALSGQSWYAITAIGGRSVQSVLGLT